jgi:hypothetical protein
MGREVVREGKRIQAVINAAAAAAAEANQNQRAAADVRYKRERRASDVMQRMAASPRYAPLVAAWNGWIGDHRDDAVWVERIRTDPTLRPLYDAGMGAETIPARAAAIKAFLAAVAAVINPPVIRASSTATTSTGSTAPVLVACRASSS